MTARQCCPVRRANAAAHEAEGSATRGRGHAPYWAARGSATRGRGHAPYWAARGWATRGHSGLTSGCFPRPDGGNGAVVSNCMQPTAAAASGCCPLPDGCSLPSALSRAAVVSTCMHPPNTAPPSPRLSQCHHGACSQRRPVRRVASAVLWKSRVLRRARSSSDAEHGSRICMQVLTTAPSILFSLSGLLALERVRGS